MLRRFAPLTLCQKQSHVFSASVWTHNLDPSERQSIVAQRSCLKEQQETEWNVEQVVAFSVPHRLLGQSTPVVDQGLFQQWTCSTRRGLGEWDPMRSPMSFSVHSETFCLTRLMCFRKMHWLMR